MKMKAKKIVQFNNICSLALGKLIIPLICLMTTFKVMAEQSIVVKFVEAYNQADSDAMLIFVTDDVKWISINDGKSQIITQNKAELQKALKQQFSAKFVSRSELMFHKQDGHYVQTIEKAFWQTKDGVKSQCSIAIYELMDVKIKNIWYFPSYAC